MARLVIGLGGSVRGVATDKIPWREMLPGHSPPRASHVEIIDLAEVELHIRLHLNQNPTLLEEVAKCKQGTMYFVDFSPLAAVTGDSIYACCLAKTFSQRADALREEVAWLQENYVNGPARASRPASNNANWVKAINLNALNNKSSKPGGANPPAGGGPSESVPGAS
jgi:hypothetical protein